VNWILLAVIIYIIFTIGTLAFALVYARVHPKDFMRPTRLQAKVQSFIESEFEILAYIILGNVAMGGLLGIALLIWAVVEIVKAIG